VRVGVIGNKTEGGKVQLGDRAIELGKSVCAVGGPADDNHRSEVLELRLAA